MIELKPCCNVPFPELLFEGYEVGDGSICANVGCNHVIDMMKMFAKMHDEPMFFILELPSRHYDGITESKILRDVDDYDIYFIDGLSCEQICEIVDAVGDFLVKDGMNLFGVGCHESHEEILFGQYNVMTIYTQNAYTYHEFFDKFGINKVENLTTAWDTFDEDHPGECRLLVSEETGQTIYDIPDTYKDYGMYLYEAVKKYEDGQEKEISHEEMIGKLLLVGITYYTHDNEVIEQKQFYGTVTEASENEVCIELEDGTSMSLPGDLSSTQRARQGEYKLRSTGEVVVNPDFLVTWNFIEGE